MAFSSTSLEELTFDTTGDEEFGLPAGSTADRPASPSNGNMRYNTDESVVEAYINGEWVQISSSEYIEFIGGNRGVFAGGSTSGDSTLQSIDYIAIDTTGNASDFGDLISSTQYGGKGALSNGTRGVFGGGTEPWPSTTRKNDIEYITFATTGNATDFGDLTVGRGFPAGCCDGTTGIFGGGVEGTSDSNRIEYITVDTTGNAQDFGDLTVARTILASCYNSSRGVFTGGRAGGNVSNIIDYVTIATTGNAVDFGDLTVARENLSGCADDTRGLFDGGEDGVNVLNTIDYITIATTGNAVDFGDLTFARYYTSSCSNGTRGVFAGGRVSSTYYNNIDYVTIQTTGNATDFGDLTVARGSHCSASGD